MGKSIWTLKNNNGTVVANGESTSTTGGQITIPATAVTDSGFYTFYIYDESSPSCNATRKIKVTCGCDGVLPPDFVIQDPLVQCDEHGTGRGACLNHPSTATTQYQVSYDPGECYKITGITTNDDTLITNTSYNNTEKWIKFTCNRGSAGWGVAIVGISMEKKSGIGTGGKTIEINYIDSTCPNPNPSTVDFRLDNAGQHYYVGFSSDVWEVTSAQCSPEIVDYISATVDTIGQIDVWYFDEAPTPIEGGTVTVTLSKGSDTCTKEVTVNIIQRL